MAELQLAADSGDGLSAGRLQPVRPGVPAAGGVDQRQAHHWPPVLQHRLACKLRRAGRAEDVGEQLVRLYAIPARHHVQIYARLSTLVATARNAADADRDVGFVRQQVRRLDRRDDPHLDAGVGLREQMQARHQPQRRDGRQDRDGQCAHRPRPADPLRRALQLAQAVADGAGEILALRGQFDAPGHAAEQLAVQRQFEVAHLPTDCALGQVQLVGRQREGEVPRGGVEPAQGVERRQRSFRHRHGLPWMSLGHA